MDEARELLEGVEDGEELLSRLQRGSLFVKAGKIEDSFSVCRESIRRVARLAELREQLLGDSGEIDQQSNDADKFSVPGVISFAGKDEKKGGGSSQQSGNEQGSGSSAQPSRVSSVSNTLGGATGGDDERDDGERDDGEKPRKKIRSQCENSEVCPLVLSQKLSGQQDEEMVESYPQSLRKRKLEETPSQLGSSNPCAECRELEPKRKTMRLEPKDIEELKKQLVDDTFDVFSLDKYGSLDPIIRYCFSQYPKAHISLVRHPTEMYEGDLVSRVIVHSPEDSMSEDAISEDTISEDTISEDTISEDTIALRSIEDVQPGTLYGSEPKIILVDFRQMSPTSISELNELLEAPARFRGRLLAPGVKVIALVSEAMEPQVDQNNNDRPGQDFWRRVTRPANTWTIMDTGPVTPLRSDIEEYSASHMTDVDHRITLDFFGEPDWRKLLYGTYSLDDTGQAQYCHSALRKLSGAPALIILKAAPWGDPAFELALRQMLFRQSYEANGEFIDLSSMTFVRQPADPGADRTLLDSVTITSSAPSAFRINDKNLEACLSTTTIIDGSPQKHDVLEAIMQQYGSLRISSALTTQQWRKLLMKIQSFQFANPFPVVIDDPALQPPGFGFLQDKPAPIPNDAHVQIIRTTSEEYYVRKLRQEQGSQSGGKGRSGGEGFYELALTPELEASQIGINFQVRSFNQRQFEIMTSGLINAMSHGQPVLLRNLHKNSLLQKQLETLLQNSPGLVVGGQLLRFPRASVTVLVPENDRFASLTWQEHPYRTETITPEAIMEQLIASFSLKETELRNLQNLKNCCIICDLYLAALVKSGLSQPQPSGLKWVKR